MNVLIACEESQTVCKAFRAKGHIAYSCDLQHCSGGKPQWHFKKDVWEIVHNYYIEWDLIIAHPPCTYLANSGVKHLYIDGKKENGRDEERWRKMEKAAYFFKAFIEYKDAPVAVENPIMHGHAKQIIGRDQDQIIQPWQFGHGETKATCLWLKDVPKLKPTNIVEGREARIHKMPPSEDRSKLRSKTYSGIAEAMAQQWGNINKQESLF